MSNENPELSILIVCYRSKELIGPMLEGLYQHTRGVEYEVLLTDCSQDGTVAYVQQRFPSVRVVPTEENLGFARGNNFLAQHACGSKLLLLNPDMLIRDNAVGEVAACSRQHANAGAWGGVTVLENGAIDPSCMQAFPTIPRLILECVGLGKWARGGVDLNAESPREVETLTGAFLMMERSEWEVMGGFDETFFMYAEELDLCYRVQRAGKPIVMTPKARITHLVGGGASLSPKRIQSIAKAKMHFFRKHFSPAKRLLSGVLLWGTAMNRSIMGALKRALGQDRGSKLVQAYWPLVRSPSQWWFGYDR